MPKLFYSTNSTYIPNHAEIRDIHENLPSQLLEGEKLMGAVAFRVIKNLQENKIIGDICYLKDDGEELVISPNTEFPYEIELPDEEQTNNK